MYSRFASHAPFRRHHQKYGLVSCDVWRHFFAQQWGLNDCSEDLDCWERLVVNKWLMFFCQKNRTDACRSCSKCKRLRGVWRHHLYISIWNHRHSVYFYIFCMMAEWYIMDDDRPWNCVNQNWKWVVQFEYNLANKHILCILSSLKQIHFILTLW